MNTTNLRKVGGSVMLAVPPAMLEMLDLRAGDTVDISIEGGHIVMAPRHRPRYTLARLLAECDPDAPLSDEDNVWLQGEPLGSELA